MSCKLLSLVALASVASGCAEDPAILVHLSGRAAESMELAPVIEPISSRQGSYRWDVVEAPTGSQEPQPIGEKTATFQPDRRGTYLIERWLTYGIGEDLTHRFVVDVSGALPFAIFRIDPPSAPVSSTFEIDGTGSSSVEGLPLTHHWRFLRVPAGSMSTISAVDARATFAPDVAGDYLIELSVFDGELWSEPSSQVASAY